MILAGGDEVSGAPSGGPVSFSQSPRFPGHSNLELCLLFSRIPDSRTCPASRLERDMELVPHTLTQGKSLVVMRRNKTCLVTCHFNENTNLSQVSVPCPAPHSPSSCHPGVWDRRPQAGQEEKQKTSCAPSENTGVRANI